MWEIIAIISLVAAVTFGFKSIHNFFLNRRMTQNVATLANENKTFQASVQSLNQENENLLHLKTQLTDEVQTFQTELNELKNVCELVGGMNEEALQKMRKLYNDHLHVLKAHIRSNAMRILLLLDDTLQFETKNIFDMKHKLSVLFKDEEMFYDDDTSFCDANILLDKIETVLLKKQLFSNTAQLET